MLSGLKYQFLLSKQPLVYDAVILECWLYVQLLQMSSAKLRNDHILTPETSHHNYLDMRNLELETVGSVCNKTTFEENRRIIMDCLKTRNVRGL